MGGAFLFGCAASEIPLLLTLIYLFRGVGRGVFLFVRAPPATCSVK